MAEEKRHFEMHLADGSEPTGVMGRGPWDLEVKKGKVMVPEDAIVVFQEESAGLKFTERGERSYRAWLKELGREQAEPPPDNPDGKPVAPDEPQLPTADRVGEVAPARPAIEREGGV